VATVRTTTRADDEAERANRWWIRNRPAARDAFVREYQAALLLLAESPRAGLPVRNHRTLRRLVLPKTGYLVFYRYFEEASVVLVKSVWHARRGKGPFRG